MGKAKLSMAGGHEVLTVDTEISDILNTLHFTGRGCMTLDDGTYKAVVFNIANNAPEDPCLQRMVNGTTISLQAVIDNSGLRWKVGDQIRIMYFNDRDPVNFNNARPYFERRLAVFGYRMARQNEYSDFSAAWNIIHPQNTVDDGGCGGLIPKQTKKDDLLSIT